MTLFVVCYINHGLWIAALLAAKDYFKVYCKLDPGEQAAYISIIYLP